MMRYGRLAYLMARKAQLDSELHQEQTALNPDQVRLVLLKRRKLMLKDEMAALQKAS